MKFQSRNPVADPSWNATFYTKLQIVKKKIEQKKADKTQKQKNRQYFLVCSYSEGGYNKVKNW